jgi:alanine racemase
MATIYLHKKHFFNNLDIIATLCKTKDKIALVLKDNAYGHGLVEMATLAQEYGIKKAVVQKHEEARKIEAFFDYILVLADKAEHPSQKIRYTINSLEVIKTMPHAMKVELKVDTGMHRNGIAMRELEEAFALISQQGLELEGVFTHHRSADELSSEWYWQNENFKEVKTKASELAKKYGMKPLRFHSANSASLFRTQDFSEDMARVGIAAYGCLEMPEAFGATNLKPVLSLHAMKNSSRTLQEGQRVGYGGIFEAKQTSISSNYDFGYGDGFLRANSNNYITPHAIKQIGRISMDNSSFLCEDAEIVIFNDAREAAQFAQTFSYEVLTSLKESIPRIIKH